MITLSAELEREIQEAVRLARESITAMKAAELEARHDDKRDGTAVYEEQYGDEDEHVDPRTIARNWQDTQERARQAQQKLENMEESARWNTDDLMAALIELEHAVKRTDPDEPHPELYAELHTDLQWARSRAFQPSSMEDELYFYELDKRLERLIEFLEDLTKPEERKRREQLIVWAQEQGMTPWGKTNKQLRQGIDHACFLMS